MKKLILCLMLGLMSLTSCATLGSLEEAQKLNKEILEAIRIQNEKLLSQNAELKFQNHFFRLFLDEVEHLCGFSAVFNNASQYIYYVYGYGKESVQ